MVKNDQKWSKVVKKYIFRINDVLVGIIVKGSKRRVLIWNRHPKNGQKWSIMVKGQKLSKNIFLGSMTSSSGSLSKALSTEY